MTFPKRFHSTAATGANDLTLRELYTFCHDNAVDCEVILKSDGRGAIRFRRDLDGAYFNAPDFDFEREAEHLPEAVLREVEIRPPRSAEERARLERPR